MKKKRRRKKDTFYHNPFEDFGDKLIREKEKRKVMEKPSVPAARLAPKKIPRAQLTDDELFLREMADVEPLLSGGDIPLIQPPTALIRDDDREALLELDALVKGKGSFDIVSSDEYVEGAVQGLDPRILQRLRRGEYAWQAYLDLHGMRVEEARDNLIEFIHTQRLQGRRCLLIIHGRGHHSPGQEPILKKRLIRWLSRGFLHKQILAFTSARSYDGGLGAMYLLLRRKPQT